MKKFNIKGFTLIELLVVIGIIAILATIGAVSFGSARAKARDAKRVGDMRGMQSAIEVWAADRNRYPLSGLAADIPNGIATNWNELQQIVQTTGINPPDAGSSYCYYANGPTTTAGTTYILAAVGLENDDTGVLETDTNAPPAGNTLLASGATCPALAGCINCDDVGGGACGAGVTTRVYCLTNTK